PMTQPQVGTIEGTVRYQNGDPVYMAAVEIVGGGWTFTDRNGHYQLNFEMNFGSTMTMYASDGFTPGVAYVATEYATVKVKVYRSTLTQDIVLDHSMPI